MTEINSANSNPSRPNLSSPNTSNSTLRLALFDLDHTLLDIDSDYTWGEYIVKHGLVDEATYRQKNQAFYNQYIAGTLDATEYNEFVASFLSTQSMARLEELRADFLNTEIQAHIRPQAVDAIAKHKAQGDMVVIISATNDFVVSAIAGLFGIEEDNVLATPLEIVENRYTGKLSNKPNFQAGKLYHLNQWLEKQQAKGITFSQTYAYSDSKNDLPLLEWADEVICVTPDDILRERATQENWQIATW